MGQRGVCGNQPHLGAEQGYYLDFKSGNGNLQPLSLAATFAPLLEKNRDVLEQEATQRLKAIRKSDLKPNQRETLEEVYLSWLTQRYGKLTKKEIRTMFGFDTPVEETVFYKEVFQEGKLEGKIMQIEREISSIRELQSFLPADVYAKKITELEAERVQLQKDLDKLS